MFYALHCPKRLVNLVTDSYGCLALATAISNETKTRAQRISYYSNEIRQIFWDMCSFYSFVKVVKPLWIISLLKIFSRQAF
jgi:hypothetical protein